MPKTTLIMLSKFKEQIQNLASQLSQATFATQSTSDDIRKELDFKSDFHRWNDSILRDVVQDANDALANTPNYFKIITEEDVQNVASENRIFCQISLFSHQAQNQNILSAPFILFEGYPKSNTVKILGNFLSESGKEISLSDLEKPNLETVLTDFLQNLNR